MLMDADKKHAGGTPQFRRPTLRTQALVRLSRHFRPASLAHSCRWHRKLANLLGAYLCPSASIGGFKACFMQPPQSE